MNDDDARLDARVRGALIELPAPDDAATRDALHVVLERSRGPRRRPRTWVAPVLAAAAVAVLALLAGRLVDEPDPTTPEPAAPTEALVGPWVRQVTSSESPDWDGRWRLTLTADGVLTLSAPDGAAASSEGASYAATDNQLRSDVFVNSVCSEMPAGVYAWAVVGESLTLSAVDDQCVDRVEVFVGTWRHAE
jgi:hypothetical protein